MPEEDVRAILERNPTCTEYYLRYYAQLYRQSVEQLKVLEKLEAPGVYPAD